MKKLRILKKQLLKMINEAVSSASQNGQEICGLLVDNGYFIELIQVNNKIKSGGGFAFYANEIRFLQKAADKTNHEIIGTFHSHPTYIAEPSDGDILSALDDSFMLIIDAMDKEVGLWYIKDQRKKKKQFELI